MLRQRLSQQVARKCDEMKKLENKKDQLSYEELVEENKILNLLIDTQKQTIDINSKTIKILFQALRKNQPI